MNIATELLFRIKARSIDSYYALEEALVAGRSLSKEDMAALHQLIADAGTPDDRLRLFLLLLLHPGAVPLSAIENFEGTLRDSGVDMGPYAFLRRALTATSASGTQVEADLSSTTASSRLISAGMRLADQVGVGTTARGLGSALAAGVQQLLPSRRETPLTRAVAMLMDNASKNGCDDAGYAYFDPKLGCDAGDGAFCSSRGRNAYGQSIVFVVGPGNYLEYQNLRQSASTVVPAAGGAGRHVTYGCTEVLNANNFVRQISQLAPR